MKALIVAGEASGDLHAAALTSTLKQRIPDLELAGVGGDRLKSAGADLLHHYRDIAVVGVLEVASKLPQLRAAYRNVTRWILTQRPAFAILVDFPDFNFRLAKFLKKHHVKIFYFISPQIWAWRGNRIHFLRNHIDLMISILPFEEQLYRDAGIPVVYVGHPLLDIVHDEAAVQSPYEPESRPLVGIMPGSRDVEVARHLPILNEAIAWIRSELKVSVVAIWPPWLDENRYSVDDGIRVEKNQRYAAMRDSDLLLVASGTSTLEAAILQTPLFIVYRVSWFSWQLGKMLVRVPYYGLVNWIAQEKCVPEYIQDRMNPRQLAHDAVELLRNEDRRNHMKQVLHHIVGKLGPRGAIGRAADAIINRL